MHEPDADEGDKGEGMPACSGIACAGRCRQERARQKSVAAEVGNQDRKKRENERQRSRLAPSRNEGVPEESACRAQENQTGKLSVVYYFRLFDVVHRIGREIGQRPPARDDDLGEDAEAFLSFEKNSDEHQHGGQGQAGRYLPPRAHVLKHIAEEEHDTDDQRRDAKSAQHLFADDEFP